MTKTHNLVWMKFQGTIYIIEVPVCFNNEVLQWCYCRKKLNVPNDIITLWGELSFSDGIATVNLE